MLSKPNSGGHGRVVVKDLKLGPLLAQVHSDVGARHGEVGTALIEAEALDFVALVQLNGLEVLQFSQIPQLYACVIGGGGQVVAVLGEGQSRNLSAVTLECGYILLLQKS